MPAEQHHNNSRQPFSARREPRRSKTQRHSFSGKTSSDRGYPVELGASGLVLTRRGVWSREEKDKRMHFSKPTEPRRASSRGQKWAGGWYGNGILFLRMVQLSLWLPWGGGGTAINLHTDAGVWAVQFKLSTCRKLVAVWKLSPSFRKGGSSFDCNFDCSERTGSAVFDGSRIESK